MLRSLITRDFRPWKSALESIGAKRIAFIITGHLPLHLQALPLWWIYNSIFLLLLLLPLLTQCTLLIEEVSSYLRLYCLMAFCSFWFFCIYFAFLAFLHCNSFFALFCWPNCQTPSLQVSIECIVGKDLNRLAKSLVYSVLLNRIFIWSHLADLWSGRKPLPWGHRPTQPWRHQLCPREQKCAVQKWPT